MKHDPYDFGGELAGFGLEHGLGGGLVLLDGGTGVTHLLLGAGASLGDGRRTSLHGLLAADLLLLEYCQAGFAKTLFVFRSASFSGRDISAGFFDGAFGLIVALLQDPL
ncbi:MAG TPA: hypothetical protein VFJ47_01920 [Terriglobales bacterium]|nr:hypothetical protein [Terriglobales bacterium]